jgi:hypothetical protein
LAQPDRPNLVGRIVVGDIECGHEASGVGLADFAALAVHFLSDTTLIGAT